MKVSAAGLTLAVGLLGGCGGNNTLPSGAEYPLDTAGVVQAEGIPRAVFRTTPADLDGTISGPSPLSVEFNLCQSRPESEEDDLKYTYDFDGNGTVDEFGHCRASHVYESGGAGRSCAAARVCVTDRRPGNEVCRSYDVCVDGTAPVGPAPVPILTEVEPNDDGVPNIGGWTLVRLGNDFSAAAADAGPTITSTSFMQGAIMPAGDEDYFRVSNPGPARITMYARIVPEPGATTCTVSAVAAYRRNGSQAAGGYGVCGGVVFDLAPGGFGYVGVLSFLDGLNLSIATYSYRLRFEVLPSQGYGPL